LEFKDKFERVYREGQRVEESPASTRYPPFMDGNKMVIDQLDFEEDEANF